MSMGMSMGSGAIVRRMHEWGNALFERTDAVTEAEVRERWTDDGQMIVNGQLKCAGVAALTRHFEEIRKKLKRARVHLPYATLVENGAAAATRYVIDVEHADGTNDRIHVGAFFETVDGRIKTMNEIVWFEHKQVELEKH